MQIFEFSWWSPNHFSAPFMGLYLPNAWSQTLQTSKRHTFRVSAFHWYHWFGVKLFAVGYAQDSRRVHLKCDKCCFFIWLCPCYKISQFLLGRLPKVDLIILEGGKMSVRPSVRPQKVSSISMKFGIQVEVDEWSTTVCRMTESKVKVTSPWKLEFLPFSKPISSAIYNGSCQPLILKLEHNI